MQESPAELWMNLSLSNLTDAQRLVASGSARSGISRAWYSAMASAHAILLRLGYTPPDQGNWANKQLPDVLFHALKSRDSNSPSTRTSDPQKGARHALGSPHLVGLPARGNEARLARTRRRQDRPQAGSTREGVPMKLNVDALKKVADEVWQEHRGLVTRLRLAPAAIWEPFDSEDNVGVMYVLCDDPAPDAVTLMDAFKTLELAIAKKTNWDISLMLITPSEQQALRKGA